MRQLEILFRDIVGPIQRKLQFHVDASAARQTPSRTQNRFPTTSSITGERGRVGRRGLDRRHPLPQHYNLASSNPQPRDSTTGLRPSIEFSATSQCIRIDCRPTRRSSGVFRHQRRRPPSRGSPIPSGRPGSAPMTHRTRKSIPNASDD